MTSSTSESLILFFRNSKNREISVAKRVLLGALGALANEKEVVENLCAASIRVEGSGAGLHVALDKDLAVERHPAYLDPNEFDDPWLPNQYALGVAFHDALARGVGKADGYDVAIPIGAYVPSLSGPYSDAISTMTNGESKRRFKTASQAIDFVKSISTLKLGRIFAIAFLVLLVGGGGLLIALTWHPGSNSGGTGTSGARATAPTGPSAASGPTTASGPTSASGPTAPSGPTPAATDRTVKLPDSLGGPITPAAMDALAKAALNPPAFRSVILLDKDGRVPVYHYGDLIKAGYKCMQACSGAVVYRSAAGQYAVLATVQAAANAPARLQDQHITPPPGREQFILVVSREPLKPGELDGNLDALRDKVSVSVAEYEVKEGQQ